MFGCIPYGCQPLGNVAYRVLWAILEFLHLDSLISKEITLRSPVTVSFSSLPSSISSDIECESDIEVSATLESWTGQGVEWESIVKGN